MSQYPNQPTALAYIKAKLDALNARVSSVITSGGQLRIIATNIAGGIWAHDHSDTANGGQVEYTPSVASNWWGNQDPGDVWQALDQLAARIKAIENLSIGIAPISYPSNTMLFNGMEG